MKTYKILRQSAIDRFPKWEDEKFLTGGTIYHSFKDAQETRKAMQKMTKIIKYKVVLNN